MFTSGNAGKVLTGTERFLKIIDAYVKILNSSLTQEWSLPQLFMPIVIFLLFIFSLVKKLFTKRQIIVIVSWIVLVFVV